MTVKTALIGLGIMGQRMLEHMGKHPDFVPTALWDPDPGARDAAQAIAPDAQIATSAQEAIDGADLVYLACPPAPRKAYALAAASAGKAIFLEKPLGVNLAESTDLLNRLTASGVPAAVNFTQAAAAALAEVDQSARQGDLGDIVGVDIIVTYAAWPRAWQQAADWLRFRDEGGMTREVISHFVFFAERILGPLSLVWARPTYPGNPALCETHMLARLQSAEGRPVTVMGSVGGAQPDRQELTVKGSVASRRVSEFVQLTASTGEAFVPLPDQVDDTRDAIMRAQLDDLLKCVNGAPHKLATVAEALRVQHLIEGMLHGKG